MTETTQLTITGMTCNHCVMNATKALEGVAGVESVDVSLEPGRATVTGSAHGSELAAAIKTAGFEAELG